MIQTQLEHMHRIYSHSINAINFKKLLTISIIHNKKIKNLKLKIKENSDNAILHAFINPQWTRVKAPNPKETN